MSSDDAGDDAFAAEVETARIEQEMEQSYIDYAMSVIAGRALPDARDGLKPVHRRILYAMEEAGVTARASHRKSSSVVGETMGDFHPHGDSAIYDALARMAQDFSMRAPLIDGQGNFGSIDGDPPAAMRYTESRMSPIAEELLADIEKDTVDFSPNYDGRKQEPDVLPAAFPNLLVNGSSGIAVGMSTNVPPHNLGEVIDATIHLIDNPDCTVEDLMDHVVAPDFPTGANIVGRNAIYKAYKTGRGRLRVRAEMEVSEDRIVGKAEERGREDDEPGAGRAPGERARQDAEADDEFTETGTEHPHLGRDGEDCREVVLLDDLERAAGVEPLLGHAEIGEVEPEKEPDEQGRDGLLDAEVGEEVGDGRDVAESAHDRAVGEDQSPEEEVGARLSGADDEDTEEAGDVLGTEQERREVRRQPDGVREEAGQRRQPRRQSEQEEERE